jgi:hypothetical protein
MSTDYSKVTAIYNELGSKEACEYIKNTYGYKNPLSIISKLKRKEQYGFNSETQKFKSTELGEETLFLQLNELCNEKPHQEIATPIKKFSLESLIQELMNEKLVELSKYIKLDRNNGTVHIYKTLLKADGYKVDLI